MMGIEGEIIGGFVVTVDVFFGTKTPDTDATSEIPGSLFYFDSEDAETRRSVHANPVGCTSPSPSPNRFHDDFPVITLYAARDPLPRSRRLEGGPTSLRMHDGALARLQRAGC